MLDGKPHSFINKRWANLNDFVLCAKVKLKSCDQGVKVCLIDIAVAMTAGEGRHDLDSCDARYMQAIPGARVA